uniref:Uncharacterized protein n=1 Tax=Chromera velia CCMP2878 TaxID=1169474 RepID=A0A0G4I289_9ALVE|eukprot:Cvel_10271.t1-p1 / transcript=Cvel_10271.t1 / gene=Cvel_10271 / organism=Chromera_velia_CCMP2878 / gene_product=hypothetical protein / transcript_product=hypothetical protein / location=Cvel_scaffold616:31016-34521(+) / protein_length=787 / sequence_SO=supercontig / SO=protein_coding / is_pseudo=false
MDANGEGAVHPSAKAKGIEEVSQQNGGAVPSRRQQQSQQLQTQQQQQAEPEHLPLSTGGFALGLLGLGRVLWLFCFVVLSFSATNATIVAAIPQFVGVLLESALIGSFVFQPEVLPSVVPSWRRVAQVAPLTIAMTASAAPFSIFSWTTGLVVAYIGAISQKVTFLWFFVLVFRQKGLPEPAWFPPTVGVGVLVLAGSFLQDGVIWLLTPALLWAAFGLTVVLLPWVIWRCWRDEAVAGDPSVFLVQAPTSFVALCWWGAFHNRPAEEEWESKLGPVGLGIAFSVGAQIAMFCMLVLAWRRREVLRGMWRDDMRHKWAGVTFPSDSTAACWLEFLLYLRKEQVPLHPVVWWIFLLYGVLVAVVVASAVLTIETRYLMYLWDLSVASLRNSQHDENTGVRGENRHATKRSDEESGEGVAFERGVGELQLERKASAQSAFSRAVGSVLSGPSSASGVPSGSVGGRDGPGKLSVKATQVAPVGLLPSASTGLGGAASSGELLLEGEKRERERGPTQAAPPVPAAQNEGTTVEALMPASTVPASSRFAFSSAARTADAQVRTKQGRESVSMFRGRGGPGLTGQGGGGALDGDTSAGVAGGGGDRERDRNIPEEDEIDAGGKSKRAGEYAGGGGGWRGSGGSGGRGSVFSISSSILTASKNFGILSAIPVSWGRARASVSSPKVMASLATSEDPKRETGMGLGGLNENGVNMDEGFDLDGGGDGDGNSSEHSEGSDKGSGGTERDENVFVDERTPVLGPQAVPVFNSAAAHGRSLQSLVGSMSESFVPYLSA